MVKPQHKKQRLRKEALQPLGALDIVDDEAGKDDEERRLESMLFGTDFKPREDTKGKGKEMGGLADESEGSDAEEREGGGGVEVLRDEDVSLRTTLDQCTELTGYL